MSELVAFLEARLAEDEAVARAAMTHRWGVDADQALRAARGEATFVNVVDHKWGGWVARTDAVGDATHVARHDPARVLREVTAKRAILAAYVDAEDAVAKYPADFPGPPPASYWQEWGNRHAWREAVELLAAPFSDHPDFQEQWR